jgi:hypothetical protein
MVADGEGPFPLVRVDVEEIPQVLGRLTIVLERTRVVENFELGGDTF